MGHGAFETRKRYRSNVVYSRVGHSWSTCDNQIETQKRSCHHGQLTDWSGGKLSFLKDYNKPTNIRNCELFFSTLKSIVKTCFSLFSRILKRFRIRHFVGYFPHAVLEKKDKRLLKTPTINFESF